MIGHIRALAIEGALLFKHTSDFLLRRSLLTISQLGKRPLLERGIFPLSSLSEGKSLQTRTIGVHSSSQREDGAPPTEAQVGALLRRIKRELPAARSILYRAAFLNPKKIPEELLHEESSEEFKKKYQALSPYGLLDRVTSTDGVYQMRSTLQRALRSRILHRERIETLKSLKGRLETLWPFQSYDRSGWIASRALAPHVKSYVESVLSLKISPLREELGPLLKRLGLYLLLVERAPQEAGRFFEEALVLWREARGEESPGALQLLTHLSLICRDAGQIQEALHHQIEAVEMVKRLYGEEHRAVASALSSLGAIYRDVGEPKRALKSYAEALKIFRALYGEEHREVAASLASLGGTYSALGKHERGVECFEEALTMSRRLGGEENPTVALLLNKLSPVQRALGESAKALESEESALKIWRALLGEKHPIVASSWNSLSSIYRELGNSKRALECQESALSVWRALYGETHPEVAISLKNLSSIYIDFGETERALECQRRALKKIRAL